MEKKALTAVDVILETTCVLGKKIRTSRRYWEKIKREKHTELIYNLKDVAQTLTKADEIYRSLKDPDIYLYYKKLNRHTLVVVVKSLNESGFIATVFQTKKPKKKGEKVWPK